ncbi:MAG: tetratricopeptide repeat protein, partial [Bacteroidota bacterium]
RRLARENPLRFEPQLAMTLHNYGNLLFDQKSYEEALTYTLEALDLRRKLTQENPQRFEPALASTLDNLGIVYMELARFGDAETTHEEAQTILRKLALQNPRKFTLNLARSFLHTGALYEAWVKAQPSEIWVQKGLEASKAVEQIVIAYSDSVHLNMAWSQKRVADLLATFRAPDVLASAYVGKGFEWLEQAEMDSAAVNFQQATALYDHISPDQLDTRRNFYAMSAFEIAAQLEANYAERYRLQQQSIRFGEAAASGSSNPQHTAIIASLYNGLAWYAIFVAKYEEAETAARKCLTLAPDQAIAQSNLAASLLFQGKFDAAQAIYSEYADQPWVDERFPSFREAFLADLAEFELAGIRHPDVGRIRGILEK